MDRQCLQLRYELSKRIPIKCKWTFEWKRHGKSTPSSRTTVSQGYAQLPGKSGSNGLRNCKSPGCFQPLQPAVAAGANRPPHPCIPLFFMNIEGDGLWQHVVADRNSLSLDEPARNERVKRRLVVKQQQAKRRLRRCRVMKQGILPQAWIQS